MSERYEEVRRALIARGYLKGPIERFILGRAGAAPGLRAVVAASAKAALLGAPILGGVLAASIVAWNRAALGPIDALVLFVELAAGAVLPLFVLDLLAALSAAAWTRRRGPRPADAMIAGLIVAVPVLAYLIVLGALRGAARPATTDVLYLAASIFTAMLVAWLAGLVSLAGIVGRTGEVPDRNRRFALIAIAVFVPLAGGVFLLAGLPAGRDAAIPPSPFAHRDPGSRLIVVGVDGLDGALVASAPGETTGHLLDLFAKGAVFPKKDGRAEPAETWTTIATGMPASAHGIRHAGAHRLPGVAAAIALPEDTIAFQGALRALLPLRTVPSSGAARRVRALWEIVGLDRRSATVGWWATWPARGVDGDPEGGYVLSDRILAKLLLGAPDDRDVAPASLFGVLRARFQADKAGWRAAFDARLGRLPANVAGIAWESYLIDTFAWEVSSRLREDPAVGAAFVYLPGLDLLRSRARDVPGAGEAVTMYLGWLDEAIFANLSKSADRIVLVADPGRAAGDEDEGFVAIAGAGASRECVGPAVSNLDVGPLVLRAAGLPVSKEMTGRAPRRCFETASPDAPAIATWGRRGPSKESPASGYDPQMVERLKSLGYVR